MCRCSVGEVWVILDGQGKGNHVTGRNRINAMCVFLWFRHVHHRVFDGSQAGAGEKRNSILYNILKVNEVNINIKSKYSVRVYCRLRVCRLQPSFTRWVQIHASLLYLWVSYVCMYGEGLLQVVRNPWVVSTWTGNAFTKRQCSFVQCIITLAELYRGFAGLVFLLSTKLNKNFR